MYGKTLQGSAIVFLTEDRRLERRDGTSSYVVCRACMVFVVLQVLCFLP